MEFEHYTVQEFEKDVEAIIRLIKEESARSLKIQKQR
jgi:hypothetical protein